MAGSTSRTGCRSASLANGAEYRRGDYWLIPARTATGRPAVARRRRPPAIPPQGPTRFLVPLAVVGTGSAVTDMRTLFTHLAWPDGQDSASKA